MKSIIKPGEIPANYITVQTRDGYDIENCQCELILPKDIKDCKELQKKYSEAIYRTGLIPIYNCHGFVFASRRTAINNNSDIIKILKDDKYIIIEDVSNVIPGDIVIYKDRRSGDIEHSAVVIEKPNELMQAKVISKWGKAFEVIHFINNCPYSLDTYKEYYRILK